MNDNNKMSVTLNLNLDESGSTIEKVFGALTAKDKKQIARDAVKSWIDEPIGAERRIKEREVVEKMLKETHYSGDKRFKSEADVREHYEFKDAMKKFVSTREKMIGEIHREIYGLFKAEVFKLVNDNEQVNEILKAASEKFAETIPRTMHNAMVTWFMTHMPGISTTAYVEDNTETHSKLLAKICEHLGIDSWV